MSFSPDYVTARNRFREAAARLGWTPQSYAVGGRGPQGEDLTIDVAISPPAEAQRVLVVSSGLHGVEGFLGSAVQLALLERGQPAVPAGVRYVLVHGLNPFGFAWSRRFDAENIDLNRNFLPEGEAYRGDSKTYGRFDTLLNPKSPPSRWDLFHARALWQIARHGKAALKQALATGQYDFPQGLFFGGAGPSRTHAILQQCLKSWIGGAKTVAHLDFHTGLGAWGTCKLLIDHPLSDMQKARLTHWFGAQSWEQNDPRKVAYNARGSLGQWCVARQYAPDYVFAFAEFGTYNDVAVIAGLRAENQAHHWGRPEDPGTTRAKARLRELFCPASPAWRSKVLATGIDLVDRAASGLLREPTESSRNPKLASA